MAAEIMERPEYKATMERLERAKRVTPSGKEYWTARDINLILGYPNWREFEGVIERARAACKGTRIDPANHFVLTHKMVGLGSGARREQDDYFLSRPACSLIAMNGQPSKPEIAAAQVYFTVQTRRMELTDQRAKDERRLELREKVTHSFRRVSGVAQDVGVKRQGIFHDARYVGLYGMGLRDVKKRKGLSDKESVLDRAGTLELSANDFQMELAAEVIVKTGVQGEAAAISANRHVAEDVRKTMRARGATLPENSPVEPPIAEVKKRLKKEKRGAIEPPTD